MNLKKWKYDKQDGRERERVDDNFLEIKGCIGLLFF